MSPNLPGGYMGKLLEVDLDTGKTGFVFPSPGELRQYIGGTGLGIKYLYERVAPGVEWDHPDNVVILVFDGKMSNSVLSHHTDGVVERT